MQSKPFRLSWTRLKELEECRAKGWLHAQGRFAQFRDNRIFFPGTVVDRAMRAFLDQPDPQPGSMVAAVDSIFDREEAAARDNGDGIVKWKTISDREATRAKCRECARRLEPILLEHVVPHDYQVAVRFEVPIQVPYRGQPKEMRLVGEMDLLVIEGAQHDGGGQPVAQTGQLKVYDLKMTENNDYWKQTFPQLNYYGLACFGMKLGWPVKSYLIQPMCEVQVPAFDFSMDDKRELFSRIVRAAEYWWDGDHSPKADNDGCAYCPAKGACPKFVTAGHRRIMTARSVTPA